LGQCCQNSEIALSKYAEFLFTDYAFDKASGTLFLRYAFANGPAFEEKIVFPPPTRELSEDDEKALNRAFRLIFLLAGVSYYKAYIPNTLRCLAFPLPSSLASFLEKTYLNGLGEFAFQNKVKVTPHFIADSPQSESPVSLTLPRRSLIPVGGGKDSIVTLDCLKRASEPLTLFAVGSASGVAAPIRDTMAVARLPSMAAKRTISNALLELNAKDALNGHVPITAIVSSIAIACALLNGFDAVIFSNENSASAPNVTMGDLNVNHQYSKSMEFEADFERIVHEFVSPSIAYFSFLRPLTEAAIARRFAALETYHPVFRSCNTAFRQDEKLRGKNWCCNCPKCRFVFLALAPFMEKQKLIEIFGMNLLAEEAQLEGFKELCGMSAHKPFECVGEIEESALLMGKLSRMDAWRNDPVVARIGPALEHADFDAKFDALFVNHPGHAVPEKYLRFLNACRGA
jgi:hypothetical protein